MKKKLFLRGLAFLLCLSLVLGFVPGGILGGLIKVNAEAATPVSILPNGDFEADAVRPLKWNSKSGDMGFSMVTTGVPGNDTNVLNLKNIGGSYLEVDSDFFSVVPGGEYRLSLKALRDDSIEATGNTVLAWVIWEDPVLVLDGKNISVKPTEQWNEYTLDVTIPEGITEAKVRLYISVGTQMAAFVDDITLIKTGGAEAPETQPTEAPTEATQATEPADDGADGDILYSADFNAGYNIYNEWEVTSRSMIIGWTGDDVARDTYEGGRIMLMQDYDANAYSATSLPIEVTPGTDIKLSYWAKDHYLTDTYNSEGCDVKLVFFDADGNEIADATVVQPACGVQEWTEKVVTATVPEKATNVRIVFTTNAENKNVIYGVDALKLTGVAGGSDEPEQPTEPETPDGPVVLFATDFNLGYDIYTEWTVSSKSMIIGWLGDDPARDTYEGGRILLMQDYADVAHSASSKMIGVVPGTKLTLSYWAKDHYMTDTYNSEGCDVKLVFFDADGKEMTNATVVQPACGVQEWTEKIVTAVVPAGAANVSIVFTTDAANANVIYGVDLLKLVAEPAGPVTLYQADFNPGYDIYKEWTVTNKSWIIGWAGDDVERDTYEGGRIMLIQDYGTDAHSATSLPIAVNPGSKLTLSYWAKDHYLTNSYNSNGCDVKLVFFDADGKEIAGATIVQPACGVQEWTQKIVEATTPANAVNVSIVFTTDAANASVIYGVDALKLEATGGTPVAPEIPDEPEVPTEPTEPAETTEPTIPEDYEAPVIENFPSAHPYLYFTAEELEELKQLVTDSEKNVYGFSWKGNLDTLLATAQYYLIETEVRQMFNYGDGMVFQLYPHLIDPNDPMYDELYIEASKDENGKLVENPHLGFGCLLPATIQTRIETLSLAYALTGDTRYSDLAIRYAVEMSQWEFWGDWDWLNIYTGGQMKADASNAWATQAVAAAYDMCYDQLTEEEKEIIETAIIEKGLKPISQQVDPFSTGNANMMYIGGMLTGCAAIINEDNYEQLKPYLELALYCTETAFDEYAYSGNTEGHYYTSYGLEYFLPGVSHMYRATGLEKLFNHTLMSEMLPYWTVQFTAPGNMNHPNYSDANSGVQMKLPMAIISKTVENGLAGYFVTQTGGLGSPWLNFVYLDPSPVVEEPTDLVAVVNPIGYGGLRTGFASDDMLLTLLANDSQMGHNHFDQNSIMLNNGGTWLLGDPGVGSYYYDDRSFWTKGGHSTILVDDATQSVKGTGAMEKIFGSSLYGYIIGSAPDAYGTDTLEKFDRHAIQLNHEERAYYIIIDDLLSTEDRTYTWQMYNGDRRGFSVDGVNAPETDTIQGNEVLMSLNTSDIKLSFVDGEKLTMANKYYKVGKDIVGYTFTASSAATKAHQFMTVLSTQAVIGRDFVNFPNQLKAASRDLEHMDDNEVSWKTSSAPGRDMVKHNIIGTQNCLFFRGGAVGDFIRVPFTVKQDGTYDASVSLGVSDGCCKVKVYIDDVESEVIDCSGLPEYFKDIEFKNLELTAGQHYVTVEIAGEGEADVYVPNYFLVNMAGMYLNMHATGDDVTEPETVDVEQVYDDENVLGALINYSGDLCDLVMFNRTDALVTAGKLSTDGQQASVLALLDNVITEGFAATKATTLVYDETVLFEAEKDLNIVADAEGWHVDTAEAQTIKLNAELGDLIVTVNGEAVEAAVEDGMIVVALAAGASDIALVEAEVEDPTDPSEPADPTDPSEPVDPSEPADPTDPSEPEGGDDNTQTGDSTPIAAMIALTVLVATGMALIVTKRKFF